MLGAGTAAPLLTPAAFPKLPSQKVPGLPSYLLQSPEAIQVGKKQEMKLEREGSNRLSLLSLLPLESYFGAFFLRQIRIMFLK